VEAIKVNIFNLAKNAGTSVDQIERFYARNLPLSKEMAVNLQRFLEWVKEMVPVV
jgi:plasmid maintenance system antidote protein VapI